MRIAICDDEVGYRQLMRERILQDSFRYDYEVEFAEYETGAELIGAVDQGITADVFFLDVQMEQGADDGIRAGRELRRRGEEGLIVYVTGFIDYVQTGYEVKAFRYLLKNQLSEKLPKVLEDIRQELSGNTYCFRTGGEVLQIDRRKILYLESRGRILRLVTTEGEYSYYSSLESAQRELGEGFLRCHRSFLVNCRHILRYSGGEIMLYGAIGIPISRTYAKEVKRKLMLEMR